MEPEIRQPCDEAYALKIVRKVLSRPPQKIVELLSVGDVPQGTMRNLKYGRSHIVSDVKKRGRLAIVCNQRVKRVWNSRVLRTIKPPTFQNTRKMRRNPYDSVVRVKMKAQPDETLRLHI
jgi:hypothetical protein